VVSLESESSVDSKLSGSDEEISIA